MFRSALRAIAVLSALLLVGPATAAEGSQPPLLHVHRDGSTSAVSDSLPGDTAPGATSSGLAWRTHGRQLQLRFPTRSGACSRQNR